MNTVQEKSTATQTRVITIVTTRGEKVKLNFEGDKWIDLKKTLEKGGTDVNGNRFSSYDLNNMKCVESIRRSTLEHPDAVVPTENFNLFLMPLKSKSGAMSRPEIYSRIKDIIAKDASAKDFFSDNGKNYTQVSSSVLEAKLEAYAPGVKKASKNNKKEAIADVVASVKSAKVAEANSGEINLKEELSRLTDSEKLDFIIDMLVDMKTSKGTATVAAVEEETVATVNTVAAAPVETEEAKAKRLEEERIAEEERKENEALAAEMAEMGGGFNDVDKSKLRGRY